MENTKLSVQENEEQFIRDLKAITGENTMIQRPMNVSFDAKSGIWSREINDIDPDTNMNKWEELGESIAFQLITTRKAYKKNFNSELNLFSMEFTGFNVTILDEGKNVAFQGKTKDLKKSEIAKEVTYQDIAYIFAKLGDDEEGTLYKMKLSGSNLINWFPYLASFGHNDSSKMYVTTAGRGERMKGSGGASGSVVATPTEIKTYDDNIKDGKGDRNKINLYYMISFEKGERFPQAIVAQRVMDVMSYLDARDQVSVDKKDDVEVEQVSGGVEGAAQAVNKAIEGTVEAPKEDNKDLENAVDDIIGKEGSVF